jgi:AhpC/TSA family.
MKQVYRFALFVLCISSTIVSIAQHSISGTIRNLDAGTLYLEAYTGLKTLLIDSLKLQNGSFVFDGQLPQGMYRLTDKDAFELEFLSVEKPIRFVMLDAADLGSVQFFDDPDNEMWTAYLSERQSFRQASKSLRVILQNYDPKTKFYYQTKEEYCTVTDHYQKLADSLVDSQKSYAARLIRTDRELPIDLNMNAEKQSEWLAQNFFRDVDFSDLSLINTNVLTTKMLDFLVLYQNMDAYSSNSDLAFVVALDKIFSLAKLNPKMYDFVMEYMLEGFSKLGLSDIVDYLLNYPQLYEGDITMEQYKVLDSITNPYQKVRVGVMAPNISGITIDSHAYNLYASSAPYTVVFFWSTECDFCHDFMRDLKLFLDKNTDIDLVTIALADKLKDVESHIRKMKISGYHFYDDLRWEGPMFKDYHVFSTPTIFILDTQKHIVSKPRDWKEFLNFFTDGDE